MRYSETERKIHVKDFIVHLWFQRRMTEVSKMEHVTTVQSCDGKPLILAFIGTIWPIKHTYTKSIASRQEHSLNAVFPLTGREPCCTTKPSLEWLHMSGKKELKVLSRLPNFQNFKLIRQAWARTIDVPAGNKHYSKDLLPTFWCYTPRVHTAKIKGMFLGR